MAAQVRAGMGSTGVRDLKFHLWEWDDAFRFWLCRRCAETRRGSSSMHPSRLGCKGDE